MLRWFAVNYPNVQPMTVRMQLRGACVNLPAGQTMRSNRPRRLVVYRKGHGQYTRYNPEYHGLYDDFGRRINSGDDSEASDEVLEFDHDNADAYRSDTEAAEFALEMHLEEFMEANWNRLGFGIPLTILAEGGAQIGRQYRTPIGIIDFLCRDESTGDYWVIELKRGQSSDAVVGQVLRYMGWVKASLAHSNEVRGLVITHEQDERLRYAVSVVPSVEAWTYQVKFEFNREGVAI
ncbi:MAG: endonuclease NucS domain-containing protein [Dehalococcoidia bacterium]